MTVSGNANQELEKGKKLAGGGRKMKKLGNLVTTWKQTQIITSDIYSTEGCPFVKDKALAEEDAMFLSSEEAVNSLERFSSSVVCITVKLNSSQAYVTSFSIRENIEDVVISNFQRIRSSQSGTGFHFRLVKPGDVRVTYLFLQQKQKFARSSQGG